MVDCARPIAQAFVFCQIETKPDAQFLVEPSKACCPRFLVAVNSRAQTGRLRWGAKRVLPALQG